MTVFANESYTPQEKTVEEERMDRHEKLGLDRDISRVMYAALYGTNFGEGDIDTTLDVQLADKYFSEIGYQTEPFIDPSLWEVKRRYYITDVLLYAGHGGYSNLINDFPF